MTLKIISRTTRKMKTVADANKKSLFLLQFAVLFWFILIFEKQVDPLQQFKVKTEKRIGKARDMSELKLQQKGGPLPFY